MDKKAKKKEDIKKLEASKTKVDVRLTPTPLTRCCLRAPRASNRWLFLCVAFGSAYITEPS